MDTNMEKFLFGASLAKPRSWLSSGNIELYSLKQSFANKNVWWKFALSPTDSGEVEGIVQKLECGEIVQFQAKNALHAIHGNFLNVQDIKKISKLEDFEIFRGEKIAFTLRVPINFEERSEPVKGKSEEKLEFDGILGKVSTSGRIFCEEEVSCVRGLLILEKVEELEVCAEMLATMFPKTMITWLTYCTNQAAWTYHW